MWLSIYKVFCLVCASELQFLCSGWKLNPLDPSVDPPCKNQWVTQDRHLHSLRVTHCWWHTAFWMFCRGTDCSSCLVIEFMMGIPTKSHFAVYMSRQTCESIFWAVWLLRCQQFNVTYCSVASLTTVEQSICTSLAYLPLLIVVIRTFTALVCPCCL